MNFKVLFVGVVALSSIVVMPLLVLSLMLLHRTGSLRELKWVAEVVRAFRAERVGP